MPRSVVTTVPFHVWIRLICYVTLPPLDTVLPVRFGVLISYLVYTFYRLFIPFVTFTGPTPLPYLPIYRLPFGGYLPITVTLRCYVYYGHCCCCCYSPVTIADTVSLPTVLHDSRHLTFHGYLATHLTCPHSYVVIFVIATLPLPRSVVHRLVICYYTTFSFPVVAVDLIPRFDYGDCYVVLRCLLILRFTLRWCLTCCCCSDSIPVAFTAPLGIGLPIHVPRLCSRCYVTDGLFVVFILPTRPSCDFIRRVVRTFRLGTFVAVDCWYTRCCSLHAVIPLRCVLCYLTLRSSPISPFPVTFHTFPPPLPVRTHHTIRLRSLPSRYGRYLHATHYYVDLHLVHGFAISVPVRLFYSPRLPVCCTPPLFV